MEKNGVRQNLNERVLVHSKKGRAVYERTNIMYGLQSELRVLFPWNCCVKIHMGIVSRKYLKL